MAVIINTIKKYLNSKNVEYKIIKKGKQYDIIFIKKGSKMRVKRCDKFNSCKKYIDSILSYDINDNKKCDICVEELKINVGCRGCCKRICGNCYINIFKTNHGIIICPFCRFTYGDIIPPMFIDLAISEILMKMNGFDN